MGASRSDARGYLQRHSLKHSTTDQASVFDEVGVRLGFPDTPGGYLRPTECTLLIDLFVGLK